MQAPGCRDRRLGGRRGPSGRGGGRGAARGSSLLCRSKCEAMPLSQVSCIRDSIPAARIPGLPVHGFTGGVVIGTRVIRYPAPGRLAGRPKRGPGVSARLRIGATRIQRGGIATCLWIGAPWSQHPGISARLWIGAPVGDPRVRGGAWISARLGIGAPAGDLHVRGGAWISARLGIGAPAGDPRVRGVWISARLGIGASRIHGAGVAARLGIGAS